MFQDRVGRIFVFPRNTGHLKILKFGLSFTGTELVVLAIGMIVSFLVSIVSIKFLMGYVKRHDFKAFGVYRIILGILVIGYFMFLK